MTIAVQENSQEAALPPAQPITDSIPAISIRGVSKRFGMVQALREVSFDIPQRGLFGVLGPNGAGKTTLFGCIASFLRPNAGSIEVLGIDVRNIAELRGKLTNLPQDAQFASNVPVVKQLVYFARLSGYTEAEAKRQADEALAKVGLTDAATRDARTLSHGMHKRLGIAQAFLGHPKVVMLDEPTAGLDPNSAEQIRELIIKFSQDATVILSSHDLAEVQRLCHSVAIINNGQLVEKKSVSELTRVGELLRIGFSQALGPEALETLLALPPVKKVVPHKDAEYLVEIEKTDNLDATIGEITIAMVNAGFPPRSVGDGMDLQDTFISLTRR